MSMESNKTTVIRSFMHHEFPGVLMVRFNDDPVSTVSRLSDAVLMFNSQVELIGVNLLNAPFIKSGYIEFNHDLDDFIENRFSSLNLNIDIDRKNYFVCGRIKKVEDHALSDHLHVCTVDIGNKDISIVCGSKNVNENMLVVVALPNAVLPDGTFISEGKVAGVPSQGMLCSLSEITGGKKPVRGLIELPKGTECGSIVDIAGLGETLC